MGIIPPILRNYIKEETKMARRAKINPSVERHQAYMDVHKNLLAFTQGYVERSTKTGINSCQGCGAIKVNNKCEYCGGLY
jgi:RecJ-like exonuclease